MPGFGLAILVRAFEFHCLPVVRVDLQGEPLVTVQQLDQQWEARAVLVDDGLTKQVRPKFSCCFGKGFPGQWTGCDAILFVDHPGLGG